MSGIKGNKRGGDDDAAEDADKDADADGCRWRLRAISANNSHTFRPKFTLFELCKSDLYVPTSRRDQRLGQGNGMGKLDKCLAKRFASEKGLSHALLKTPIP